MMPAGAGLDGKNKGPDMLSPCDGCQRVFTENLTLVNAKKWKPSICDTPTLEWQECKNLNCVCNIEGICIEYQFCDACLSSQEIVDKTFEEFLA